MKSIKLQRLQYMTYVASVVQVQVTKYILQNLGINRTGIALAVAAGQDPAEIGQDQEKITETGQEASQEMANHQGETVVVTLIRIQEQYRSAGEDIPHQ